MERHLRGVRLRRLALAADAAKKAWEDARTVRDDEIEAADVEDQWTLRQIADDTGLHPAHVHRVVSARTATRQARLAHAAGLA
jgi:predicted DsbA family dithiol-disulfide isomerase